MDLPCLTPPPPHPRTFHYGPKMYLRVSQRQSHLFPGQPCTGVIALCARVPSCLQSVAYCAQITNASFKLRVHCFCDIMAQMQFTMCLVIPSAPFRTDTKFKYLLELGEGLCAGTVSRVSERLYNTTMCPIFIIRHISVAHFGNHLVLIIVWGISDLKLLD